MLIKGTLVIVYGKIISDRVKLIILAMGILSIAGFTSGYLMSGFSFKVAEKSDFKLTNTLVISVIVLASISGVLLFGIFYDSILRSSSSYSGNIAETYNNSVYAYLKEIFTYSLAVSTGFLGMGKRIHKILALIPTAILIAFGLISSDKDPLLLAVLGWGIPFFYSLTKLRLQKVRTYFIILILVSLFIPAFSLVFTMYRAGALDAVFKQMKMYGLYTFFDASGPYESLVDAIEDPNIDFEYGKTYYWGFIGWIPKSVWPDRPLDLSESYAKEKIQNWHPGRGLGYSLLTEAYKNFGVPGALIQYFLIGLLTGLLGKLFFWLFRHKAEAGYIFFIWLAYNLAIMHRGPFNLPSSFIRFLLPFLFCYFGMGMLYMLYNRWRKKRA